MRLAGPSEEDRQTAGDAAKPAKGAGGGSKKGKQSAQTQRADTVCTLHPYGNEKLVDDVTQFIRQDPATGTWDGKVYELPPRDQEGQFESLQLREARKMSASEAEALRGVFLWRSKRAGGGGLSEDAADRLEETLRSDPANLLRRGAVMGPVREHWNQDPTPVTGEGIKTCVLPSKEHLQRSERLGMHKGKETTDHVAGILEGSTSAATVESMQSERNVMDASGLLHGALEQVLDEVKASPHVRRHLANVLGSDDAVQGFGLNSEDLLVVHANAYGNGPGAVMHGDFEGDKKDSSR